MIEPMDRRTVHRPGGTGKLPQAGTEIKMQALKGTKKQVTWAEQIRREKLAVIGNMMAKGNAQIETLTGDQRAKAEQSRDQVMALVAKLEVVESASFWIDARHDNVQMLMQSAKSL